MQDYAMREGGGAPSEFLRVDVHPSNHNPDLLPQTFHVDGWWMDEESVVFAMDTPVAVEGTVQSSQQAPRLEVNLERRRDGVEAQLEAMVPGTVMAGAATTEADDGSYRMRLPPADDYTFAVVPVAGGSLPFRVLQSQDFRQDEQGNDLLLDRGTLITGLVTTDDGSPVVGVQVQPVETQSQVEGPVATTDANGRFRLRVAEGSYNLLYSGVRDSLVPSFSRTITVDDSDPVEADLELGSLSPVTTRGLLQNSHDRPVSDAMVRFTALALDEHPEGELTVTTETNEHGRYEAPLLPGRWRLELVPDTDTELSPQVQIVELGQTDAALDQGSIELSDWVTAHAQVVDSLGEPAARVTVVATERGFEQRSYSATTDETGHLALQLPAVAMDLVLTPVDASSAVTGISANGGEIPAILELTAGTVLQGSVFHEGEPVALGLVEIRDGNSGELFTTTLTDMYGGFEVRVDWDYNEQPPAMDSDGDTGAWDTAWVD